MTYVASFLAGAFLCNAVPHLVCGLTGTPFPTPFAKPRGIGDSSPLVNFLWGAGNLLVGGLILARHPMVFGAAPDSVALVLGVLALGVPLSRHFGKVRRGRGF